ncbi:hypothetical protein L227DRAFT_429215 [Lentinus tigrinus ALCF2SS1-6]|uniref:Uncharacterized protein n=1 Tax=Lentinus tigrinus ALCF2SS1-6 TaxID=1328759 RepID=A0A5C2SGZ1_9APHY|nr:hypothetical protein L227DRAFT_429215 [Lentinus tigrinus ALCF2SS1-6]
MRIVVVKRASDDSANLAGSCTPLACCKSGVRTDPPDSRRVRLLLTFHPALLTLVNPAIIPAVSLTLGSNALALSPVLLPSAEVSKGRLMQIFPGVALSPFVAGHRCRFRLSRIVSACVARCFQHGDRLSGVGGTMDRSPRRRDHFGKTRCVRLAR